MWQNQLVRHAIRRLRERDLPVAVSFWNGHVYTPPRHPLLTLKVNHARALGSLAAPSLGKLATAYVQQQFDIGGNIRDILAVGERLCEPDAALDKKGSSALSWLRHTKPADRKNISYHYDVSNDFYALWLDAQRVYSCAYFKSDGDDLDTAQKQKLDLICRKLMLKPGERVLDVGCGWGALILWAAKHYGAHCLGITLSKDQHAYVKEVVKQLGLEDRVEVRLMDYRDVPESNPFDKIASVGMFEHVGRRNLNAYFGKMWRLLRPGGLVMNHGITATSLDSTELGNDIGEFIEQYVFPGGELVHVARVMESLSTEGLECLDVESLRPHYAKTLWHWVERLEANAEQARQLVGEQKFRIWRIYMAGSALAFTRGWISLFQVLAGKPEGNGSIPYPYRRDHVYS